MELEWMNFRKTDFQPIFGPPARQVFILCGLVKGTDGQCQPHGQAQPPRTVLISGFLNFLAKGQTSDPAGVPASCLSGQAPAPTAPPSPTPLQSVSDLLHPHKSRLQSKLSWLQLTHNIKAST